MFKAVLFVVYIDPKDIDNREKVLKAMIEARKKIPLTLKSDAEGGYDINREKDVLFLLSSTP